MEIIPIIDKRTLKIKKNKKRSEVKEKKLWHLSTIILVFNEKTGEVLLQIRPQGKTYAGRIDSFGGLVGKTKETQKLKRKFKRKLLDKIMLKNALKEINEELNIFSKDGSKKLIKKLKLLKPAYKFIEEDDIINEVSNVYLLKLKKNYKAKTYDDINGIEIKTVSKYYNFFELVEKYKKEKKKKKESKLFASGLARILEKYIENKSVKKQIDKQLKK